MKIRIHDDYERLADDKSKRRTACCPLPTLCFLSLWRFVAVFLTLLAGFCILLLCKAYIRFVLLWLESQDKFVVGGTLTVLFVLVSLPVSIGYIVLVGAAGYLFGLGHGMLLTVFGANFGLLVAHNILRLIGHHRSVYRYTQNDTAQAIMRVIAGPLCFKIVFFSRLTPVPFGLQNTIFALSNVNSKIYHVASLFGLLPAQFVGVYVGSTLRSMQDVLENRHFSSTTYAFVALQIVLAIVLIFWLGAKARTELLKAIAEADNTGGVATSSSSTTTSSSTKRTSFSIV